MAEQGEAQKGFGLGNGIVGAAQDGRGLECGLDEALQFRVVKAGPPGRRRHAGAGEGAEAGAGLDGGVGGDRGVRHAGARCSHEGSEHDSRKAGRADHR